MGDELQPYVGPRPFEREDQARFFGRDSEARRLLSLTIAHSEVLLYAQSGAGKTSLLNAKLMPLLEENGFDVLPTARVRGPVLKGVDPNHVANVYVLNTIMNWSASEAGPGELAGMSLADFLGETEQSADEEVLLQRRVIIFDQFEELFTFYQERRRDRADFFHQVSAALQKDPMLRVIFVLREEYLAHLESYARFLPEKLRTRFRLERLRSSQAIEAVERPLECTGYSFAKDVAATLVEELLKERVMNAEGETIEVQGEYVEPVQLQIVCQSLWQNRPEDDRVITSDHLEKFGGVEDALRNFYERVIDTAETETSVRKDDLRRWFSNELITPAGTRGTVFRGEGQTGSIPNSAVDVLANHHIVRAEKRAGGHWYELTHDRLIEPVLKANETWARRHQKEEQERQLAEERQRGREEEQARTIKRFRLLAAVLVILLLGTVAVTVFALYQRGIAQKQGTVAEQQRRIAEEQRRIAEEQRKIALARQLAAEADFRLAEDSRLAVLLAMESIERLPDPEEAGKTTRDRLEQILRTVAIMKHNVQVNSAEFSPDGKYLALALDDGATLRELNTSALHRLPMRVASGKGLAVYSVAFSPDGDYLATGDEDAFARVWKRNLNEKRYEQQNSKKYGFLVSSIAFSPDGNCLAIASYDKDVLLWKWDLDTTESLKHERLVDFVNFSPDGKYLATRDLSKAITIWKMESRRKLDFVGSNGKSDAVAFSPDSNYIATASDDNTARVWKIDESDGIREVRSVLSVPHNAKVNSIAFSSDGEYLAMGSNDNTARVWELDSGEEKARMEHDNAVKRIMFSPDDEYLVTIGYDNIIRTWLWRPMALEELKRKACKRVERNLTLEEWGKYLPDEEYCKTCPDLPVPDD